MPDTLLMVGNTVATSIPEVLLNSVPEVDIAVIGEGDVTAVEIASAVANKEPWQNVHGIAYCNKETVVRTQNRQPIARMEDIPFPDYTLFDIEKYLDASYFGLTEPLPLPREQMKSIPLNTARGCPFSCTFCTHAFKEYRYRYYPFDMVIEYFSSYRQSYDGVNYLNFWDELTIVSRKRMIELCDVIENAGLKAYWRVSPRGDLFNRSDLQLLKRCKDLGAMTIGGALESGDPEILLAMNKSRRPGEYIERFIEQMNAGWEAGLSPTTSLVFGYPQETRETIKKTLETCRQARVYPSSGFLLPLPGTPMYEMARERDLVGDEEEYLLRIGDRQDLHVNLTQMADNDLVETVTEGLMKLRDKLGISMNDEEVIKTTYNRATMQSE